MGRIFSVIGLILCAALLFFAFYGGGEIKGFLDIWELERNYFQKARASDEAFFEGDMDKSEKLIQECLEYGKKLDYSQFQRELKHRLAQVYYFKGEKIFQDFLRANYDPDIHFFGDLSGAREYFEKSIEIFREVFGESEEEWMLSEISYNKGDALVRKMFLMSIVAGTITDPKEMEEQSRKIHGIAIEATQDYQKARDFCPRELGFDLWIVQNIEYMFRPTDREREQGGMSELVKAEPEEAEEILLPLPEEKKAAPGEKPKGIK